MYARWILDNVSIVMVRGNGGVMNNVVSTP
jgi:hypothetical protein